MTTMPLPSHLLVWRGDVPFLRYAPGALVGGAMGDLQPLFNGLRQKAFSPADLREVADLAPYGPRGRWRELAATVATNPWSPAELDAHQFLHRTGFRRWKANPLLEVAGRRIRPDVLFEGSRTIFELQSRQYHAPDEDRTSDWARHNVLTCAGYTVLHYTPADLRDRPDAVVRQLLGVVHAREAPAVSTPLAPQARWASGMGP
ncbi:endonuclease domain-containing protein [Aestuariimicrobium soli]|uniref:endonuclease domain-containing protein n=1 Tax=Aestuariimicrobium soli TaxID=2035834 RepID=UPI003EBDB876